jgi:heme oxygenase|tara:strand:+ start:660 stop:1205 length:546 start_codon:yes stop_codon:yes gene_type:complete
MSTLKELTWEAHKNAERQAFVMDIFHGRVEPKLYAEFLYNQHAIYDILEATAMMHGLFNDVPTLRRAPSIMEDFKELWGEDEAPKLKASTLKYLDHIFKIREDVDKVMAHVYVRHMGDLSGGQILKKKVPGSGKLYHFEEDVKTLKEKIRAKCKDEMADEAKICFNFATEMFKEMQDGQVK